jgi:hypothetical protein
LWTLFFLNSCLFPTLFSSLGNIIISEFTGHRIRKIIVKENRVVTVAGFAGKREQAGHADGPNTAALLDGPSGMRCWVGWLSGWLVGWLSGWLVG